jgi:hypothetical protein
MKKITIALFFALQLCLYSCLPAKVVFNKNIPPDEDTTFIRIEYKDGQYVAQQIIQVLRTSGLADLNLYKSYLVADQVEARFRTLTKDKEQRLKRQLEQIVGVLYIDVVKEDIPNMPTASPLL